MPGHSQPRSRRGLLTGRPQPSPAPIRPPWALTSLLASGCTGCGICIERCPEQILLADARRQPVVDFARGECTFCGACADLCPEPVFDRTAEPPWRLRAQVGAACLAARGIVCEVCRDNCPAGAIRFRPAPGRIATPTIDRTACTGCGACAAPCPTAAITLAPSLSEPTGHVG